MAFVRAARPDDAPDIARIHLSAWRDRYPDWPVDVWHELEAATAIETWRQASQMPPSARHHVLVATDVDDRVCGFLTLEPSADGSLDAHSTVQIFEVDPAHRGQGHGSRLMSAAVEYARSDTAIGMTVWLDQGSDASRFLVDSGWGPRGIRRVLDVGGGVHLAQHEWWTALHDA